MTESGLSGVGLTALSVARVRAAESQRPDRLFNDPFAAAFAAAAPAPLVDPGPMSDEARALREFLNLHVRVRTRFFDEYLLRAVADGCRQVVLVAAGLDTRAFRLAWPDDVTVYELDTPAVFAFKDRILGEQGATPAVSRIEVPVDLREDWPAALAASGFDRAQPTAWLIEGLLVYLESDEVARLLSRVTSESAAGSRLGLETGFLGGTAAQPLSAAPRTLLTSLWHGGMLDAEPTFLAEHGWEVHVTRHTELARTYGRPDTQERDGGYAEAVKN